MNNIHDWDYSLNSDQCLLLSVLVPSGSVPADTPRTAAEGMMTPNLEPFNPTDDIGGMKYVLVGTSS
jgi:hypothetical protein